jgi:hypothetical protein
MSSKPKVAPLNETRQVTVEPADEGPPVKPKRILTDAQLEALKKGRERLAEKRKAAQTTKEDEEDLYATSDEDKPTPRVVPNQKQETHTQTEDDTDNIDYPDASWCTVM